MPHLSAEERALFEASGAPLYEEAVADGLPADDERIVTGGPLHDALRLLMKLGLLVHDREGGTYQAVDPSAVQSRVVTPLSQQGAELLAESGKWAKDFGTLAQVWRRSPSAGRGPFTELQGSAIAPFITALVSDAESELLTAQPQTARTPATFAAVAKQDIAALERGVKMRTLYQHSARRSASTHKYVTAVTERGAEVRTLDEFFNRLIVVDRRVALIPSRAGYTGALAIREPSMVAYLVDMFERSWERARPFTNRESSMVKQVAAEQRAMTIRMLLEGHADPSSAKRLGVSPRTYAGYVADLKAEYEAETRFQLGYAMGALGVSGREERPVLDDE
jgi:hypothetical protein